MRFWVAFGAYIADAIFIIVPLGNITLARPCPSSTWFWLVIVVITLFEGVLSVMYFATQRMECEVPLSTIQLMDSLRLSHLWRWL